MKKLAFFTIMIFATVAFAKTKTVESVSNFLSGGRGSVKAEIFDNGHLVGRKFRINVSTFCHGGNAGNEWEDVDAQSYCAYVPQSLKVDAENNTITLIVQEPDFDKYQADLAAADTQAKKTKVQMRCIPKKETVVFSMEEYCK